MNFDSPSTQLLFVTIYIEAIDISQVGTGFITTIPLNSQNQIPVLVTSYHVIKNATNIYVEMFKANKANGQPIPEEKFKVKIDNGFTFHDEILDIAFIPLAPILNTLSEKNVQPYFKSIVETLGCSAEQESKLAAIEEVIFIGYPYGLHETSSRLPIVRRGITATPAWSNHSADKNCETFLIDAGVFPGSSGSPVFIYNQGSYSDGININIGTRLIFLGMIKASIQNTDNKQFIGLGEVIKAKAIFKFIKDKLRVNELIANYQQ